MTKYLDFNGLNKVIEYIKDKFLLKSDFNEKNVQWYGSTGSSADFTSVTPIDAGVISELGNDRFIYSNTKGITVERSIDNGQTWVDQNKPIDYRPAWVTQKGNYPYSICGSNEEHPENCLLRITYTFGEGYIGLYAILCKFCIFDKSYTNLSDDKYCTIQYSTYEKPDIFQDLETARITHGYNVINTKMITTVGSNNKIPSYVKKIRFIFGSGPRAKTGYGYSISKIMAYGPLVWECESNMAQYGHLYYCYDNQEAHFPYIVSASRFKGTADNATTVNNHTVEIDVPADAKFTDTTYDAVSTDDIQKWIDEEISVS